MNININDIKNGMTVIIDGNLCLILDFQHVKPGKGPAFVRIKLKNLKTGSIVEETFNTNIKVERAHVDKLPMQFLYTTGDTYHFMNTETYEQMELNYKLLEEEIKFLKENLEIEISLFEGEVIGINLPEKVTYEITETEPALRGNTSGNALKDATIETGYVIKVPMFINQGDQVIVSTKDGKYNSRA
ncbi:MAG: elongation factor P [Mollicutes bacterium]|jgi:elongation factor P|nr:elongation factor P [Mollicutes bacterium]